MLTQTTVKSVKVNYLVKIGVLSAIAAVVMFLEFMIPMMPIFLKMDFSEIPVLLGTFALGPTAGIAIELIKNIVHAFFTQTYGIGELANFIVGVAFVVPAAIIYQQKKSRCGAIAGMVVGTISMTLIAAVMNYFVFIPLYQTVLNWPLDMIVSLGTKANAAIIDLKTLIIFGIAPFNLLKGIVISIVMLAVYKKVSPILHK